MIPFDRDDLAILADNTRSMLRAGIHVPLWSVHTPPDDAGGGPQLSRMDARDNRGWLKDVVQLEDGSLEQILEVADEDAAHGIESGTIRFSSPEIGEYVDGLGRNFGTVIRHMALVGNPRNPNQGPFETIQFSLDDLVKDFQAMAKTVRKPIKPKQFNEDEEDKGNASEGADGSGSMDTDTDAGSIETSENPDMPPARDGAQKEEAIIAHMSELGVELPSDFKLGDENAIDILLATLKTATKAKAEAEVEGESEEDLPPLEEDRPPMGNQFSERDQHMNATIEGLRKQLIGRCRKELTGEIERSGLPPGLRKQLAEKVPSVQFSEDGDEKAVYTTSQVVAMFKSALPKGMQFGEDGLIEAKHNDGDGFFDKGDGKPKTVQEAIEKNKQIRESLRR